MSETLRAEEWLEESVPVKPGGRLFINADRGSLDVRCARATAQGRLEPPPFTSEIRHRDVRKEGQGS